MGARDPQTGQYVSTTAAEDPSVSGAVESLADADRYRSEYDIFQATLFWEFDTDGTGGQETYRIKTNLEVPNLGRDQVAELVAIRPERFDVRVSKAGVVTTPQSGRFEGSLFWPYSIGTQQEDDSSVTELTVSGGLTANGVQTSGRTAWNLDEVYRGATSYETGFNDSGNGSGGGGVPVVQPTNMVPMNYRAMFGRGPLTGPAINESQWEELGIALGGDVDNQEAYTLNGNFSVHCFADIWQLEGRDVQDIRRANG